MVNKWKKERSSVVFKHPRLTVVEDDVVLANGNHTTYLCFEHKSDAVLVIPVRKDGKILMQKEYSYPQDKELLQFPSGSLLSNEERKHGANRELNEEAQLHANKLSLLGFFFLDNRRSKTKVFVYLGSELTEPKKLLLKDEEESFSNHWYSEDEIDGLVQKGKIVIFPALSSWCLYKSRKLKR